MTWLYVPGTSSPFAPASEASSSESLLPSTLGERAHAASVTWRGKQEQPRAWSRRWKRGGFIQRLSGLTCSPSTLDAGVDTFISSLAETPAKRTASPESAQDQRECASSLPKSFASPTSAGLILSSAKTSRGTLTGSLKPSSRHWSDWATALRQEYSVRPRPEIPCGASDSSSWPSAKVSRGGYEVQKDGSLSPTLRGAAELWMAPRAGENEETAESFQARRMRMTPADRMGVNGTLSIQVQQWSAPKASDGEKGGPNQRGSKGDVPLPGQAVKWESPSVAVTEGSRLSRGGERSGEMLLTGQAMATSDTWAGPAAQNHKGSSEGSSEGSIIRADGKSREDILSYQAEQFFRLPSSPDLQIAGGSMSSTDGPNTNQPSVKRKLNPIFVEALMRWPTGLSGFERQETAWTQWWQLMPSYVLALCSQKPAEQGSLF